MVKKIEQRSPQRPAPHITQQNLRPQIAPDTPEPEVVQSQSEESLPETQRSKSFFSLLGTAVLGIALACAAVPYSLGWLTPEESTKVANADEPIDEGNENDPGNPESTSDSEIFEEDGPFPPADERVTNKVSGLESPPFEEDPFIAPELGDFESELGNDALSLDTQEAFPDLTMEENAVADDPPVNLAPHNTLSFAVSPTSPQLPTGSPTAASPPPTFAPQPQTPAPVRQQVQGHAPPKRPQQNTVVGIKHTEIVEKAPRSEQRNPYGHSQNVKMQPSGPESYEPHTTHPMSENDPSFARNEFDAPFDADMDDDEFNAPPPHHAPPERLPGQASINRSEVQPRYARQSLQDGHDDEFGERITPHPQSQHSQSQHPQDRQPQARSRRNSREPYQLKHAQMRVRQDVRGLPNEHGQVLCEYDITNFTKVEGIPPGSLPEQTIVNWIKKQTGEQIWHTEPLGFLSASSDTLYVYHTPKVQSVIAQVVDRFVNPHASEEAFTFRIVSLNGPNWLAQSHGLLKPIRIDSPGTRGWLLEKEDHARLIPELTRRSDYKELCSPQFPIRNGREYVVSSSVPKNYTPDAQPQNNVWPGYATEMSVINEGYKLSLTPLLGVDGATADIMIQCESLQVEKMHSISLNVNNRATSRQRIPVEAPQIAQFHLEEQIVWPKDKILLISLGTVPVPAAAQFNDADRLIPGISRKISGAPAARGHILLIVECRKL